MLSTNTDFSSQIETSSRDTDGLDVETPTSSKRTLRDCEQDNMLGSSTSSSSLLSVSSNLSKAYTISVMSAHQQAISSNVLIKLQGQRWQQYFDFEKVLKQMRYAEKAHLKTVDMEHHASSSSSNSSSGKSSSFSSSVVISQKSKYAAQKQKQVQRLSGSDMQYYGLAPKQEALEIVICNVCKGIYTKVGFSNHMLLQHAAIWSTVPTKSCAKVEELIVNALPDSGRDEHLRDLERIELVGISSDSSATASSTMSSSSSSQASSSFGSSTRAAKGNRSSNSSGGSNNGRSRCKVSKAHLPTATSILSVQSLPQQNASPTVGQLLLSSSSNSKSSSNSLKLSSTTPAATTTTTTSSVTTTTATTTATTAVQANATVKMLPTFGNASATHSNSTPAPTVLGISGSFSNSSNSSTSSSSMSSTSSKSSSQSKTSSPSITFPTLLSLPLADASNNANAQFEIVSSSTPYYASSTGKGTRKNTNFSTDSFEKTDDNATITSISDLKALTSVTSVVAPKLLVSTSSSDDIKTTEMDADQKLNNMTLGSASILFIPTPNLTEKESYQQLPVSTNNRIDIGEVCSTSDSIISSTVDILQPTSIMTQHDYGLNKTSCNIERLQMSTVSTSCMSPTLMLAKSNPYAKMAATTPNSSDSKLNFDKICGVNASDEYGSTPCSRPLTCSVHSHALKRQVPGRSKSFDELLAYYCASKEVKATYGLDIDFINSSTSANFERRSVFGTLVAVPNMPCTTTTATTEPTMENNSFSSNLSSTLKFIKPIPEKAINHMNSQERSEFGAKMPLYSTSNDAAAHDKSKLEPIHSTAAASSSSLSQVQLDSFEQSCDERVQNQNSSDENSILTLEGIFDHNTQLEMLDSKFITEILNTAESDINFDELEGSSSTATTTTTTTVQTRLPQPATKRLRIDDSAIQAQTQDIEKALSSLEHQQLQTYVAEQSAILNHQSIDLKSNNVFNENGQQQDKKQIEIQYQTELNNVLQQHQQEQISAIEAMQFQQLLYQQCSFSNVDDNMLEQHHQKQQMQQRDNISKEVIDLSMEDEVLKTDRMGKVLTLDSFTSDIKQKDTMTLNEYNIDEDSCEEMEWNFNVFNVPSLTDDNNEEITIDSLVEFTTNSKRDGTEQYGLPNENDLLFEITADNSVSMQQKQVIAELLTQKNYKAVANLHFNNSNKVNFHLSSMDENRDDKNEDLRKSALLSFDFSLIETPKSVSPESKCKFFQKQNFDDLNMNIQMFNCVPRPLTINHFGLIKFPLSMAIAFRRDLLISRKANNNPITLTGSGSSVLGNCINGCIIGGNSINARFSSGNATKNISNVTSLNSSGSSSANNVNEFAIGNVVVTNSTNSSLPKLQRNGNVDLGLQTSVPSSSSNIASSSNGTMLAQGNTLHRLQKNILNNNTLTSYPCANGKSKVAINSAAPIAIVNPTARLSVSAQTNQNNIHTFSNNSSYFAKNVQTASNNTFDTDRVKLVKRSSITKLNTLKSTYFTPKIITELLMGSSSLTANFLEVPNGNCESAVVKPHTITYYRRKSLYAKRRIYKLSQQRAGSHSMLNIAREKKHKTLQAILP